MGSEQRADPPSPPPQLFVDKDTIVNAVGASHDIHLLKIDNREDELVTRINSWCTQLVDKVSSRGASAGPLPPPPPHRREGCG